MVLRYDPPDGCATAHFNAVEVSADTTVDAHIDAINILLPKLKQITDEIEEAIGWHIIAIRAAEPRDWERVVRIRCGVSRSRAYEYIAIADGTKSAEKTRRARNARQPKYRAKCRAVRHMTDSSAAAAQAQVIELQAAHKRQIERYEAKLARLGNGEALSAERDGLRGALGRIEKLLAEARALTTHYRNNESDVKARIGRALTIARTALQPGKATTGNSTGSSVKRAA